MQSHPDFTGNIVRQNEQRRSPRYCLEHRSVASCFPHTRLAYPVQSHKVSIKEEYHPLITSRRRHTVIESPTMSHFPAVSRKDVSAPTNSHYKEQESEGRYGRDITFRASARINGGRYTNMSGYVA